MRNPGSGEVVSGVSVVGDGGVGWEQGVGGDKVFNGEGPPFIQLAEIFVAWLCSNDAGGKLEMQKHVEG